MGNSVYVVTGENKEVLALFTKEEVVNVLKEQLEKKFNTKVTIEKRTIDLPMQDLGIFK